MTTYAYLTHPVVVAWGEDWLARGGGEVRFRSPVFEADELRLVPVPEPETGAVVVEARSERHQEGPLATFRAVADSGSPPAMRRAEVLPVRQIRLQGELGADYGLRAGDDLELFAERGFVHPAVWPAIGNLITHAHVVRGSWIHLRSIVRHHELVVAGAEVDVHSVVVERYRRGGERAILDIRIEQAGRPVATLEHEAIVALDG